MQLVAEHLCGLSSYPFARFRELQGGQMRPPEMEEDEQIED